MTAPESPALALVGAVLNGRWKLIRLLGEGGMGAVYEAEGIRGEGRRAIKVLHQEFVQEEAIRQRFYAEAQAARSLQHPNVAQVEGSATAEDGTPYLVMELLHGVPLGAYMDEGKTIPPHQAVPVIYAVLQALSAAHAGHIVHRDLKPDNVFLVRDARGSFVPKVLDFGIAKVMDLAGGMGAKTRTGMLLGTPGYMSPEQIKNAKGVDARSDLWSVGIIFYEMLAGQMPFHAETEFARLTAVLTEPVVPIEKVRPELASWAPFFQRALAKEPAQRFQSAEEMARSLAAFARGPSEAMAPTARPEPVAPVPPQATLASASRGPASQSPAWQATPAPSPGVAATAPSAPLVQLPTHASAPRQAGSTLSSGAGGPSPIAVIDAPPLQSGAPWWLVGVVGFVCLGLGFAAGFLAGG